MGYTHYWRINSDLTQEFPDFLDDARKVLRYVRDDELVAGPYGTGVPFVVEDTISLNGVGDESHETFGIGVGATDFNFCKTARKPYDVVVTALLSLLKHHAPDKVSVSSDGYPSEWEDGVFLAREATDKDITCPLDPEE